jgi:hypothetical protein
MVHRDQRGPRVAPERPHPTAWPAIPFERSYREGRMKRDGRPGRAWTKRGSLPMHWPPRLDTLEACREAWAERNPEGLRWGIIHCSLDGGLPQWLAAALLTMLKLRPVQRRFWEPYKRRLTHYLRFAAVRNARKRGLTWEEAYAAASEALAQTDAFGSAATMKKSYRLVSRTGAARRGGYSLAPPKE